MFVCWLVDRTMDKRSTKASNSNDTAAVDPLRELATLQDECLTPYAQRGNYNLGQTCSSRIKRTTQSLHETKCIKTNKFVRTTQFLHETKCIKKGNLLRTRHELKMQIRVDKEKKARDQKKSPLNATWIKNANRRRGGEEGARSKEMSFERGMI